MQNRIFSTDSAKAAKARGFGYLNAIHYMAPATMAGVGNLCSHASPSCIAACLGLTSGQAGMVKNIDSSDAQGNSVRQSRIDKAHRFMRDRKAYMRDVVRSIELLERKAAREGLALCVRMNGSTDIAFEGIQCERNGVTYRNLMEAFPHIQFVDYTKNHMRLRRVLPSNYSLTLSRHEKNEELALAAVSSGHNVAVVFDKLPATYRGFNVIDGDKHDLRHLDPRGVIVGLSPKGRKAKKDTSGFVVRIAA
jgi:hypothetical protein